MASFANPAKHWIPDDCIYEILKYLPSPLTMLTLRLVSQQLHRICVSNRAWKRVIQGRCPYIQGEDDPFFSAFPSSLPEGDAYYQFFFRSILPLRYREALKLSNGANFDSKKLRRYLRKTKPIVATVSSDVWGAAPISECSLEASAEEVVCENGCGANFPADNIPDSLRSTCYSFEQSSYSQKPDRHVGFCSEDCFRKHLITLSAADEPSADDANKTHDDVDQGAVIAAVRKNLHDYYGRSKQAVQQITDLTFSMLMTSFRGEEVDGDDPGIQEPTLGHRYHYVWWGGSHLTGVGVFDVDDPLTTLLVGRQRAFRLGVIISDCSNRMSETNAERRVYFLFRDL